MSETHYGADQLNELTKEIYSNEIEAVVPEESILANLIDFNKSKKLGQEYVHPVLLTNENGFTYSASEGDLVDLAPPSASNVKKARIRSTEMILRTATSIKNLRSQETDKDSFKRHLVFLIENMRKSMYHRLEIQLMYGDAGLAVVDSAAGAVLTIKAAEWAPAIWHGSEGALIEVYSSAGALRGQGKIVSVSQDDRTITLEQAIPGVVDTDEIFWKGSKGQEFKGLHAISATSGSLFGIDNTVYDLFKPTIYPVGANAANPEALSFNDIQRGVAQVSGKGFGKRDMTVIVNTKAWVSLMNEQMALRSYDQSYKNSEVETGAQMIKFHSQNGLIKIVASNFCKEGYAYGLAESDFMRIGINDVDFKDPITGEDKYFRHLDNQHGVEVRAYSDQALFTSTPARLIQFAFIDAEQDVA